MKKILVTLLVLALCAPAMAFTVDIATSGVVTLTTEAGEANIVGVSLDLSVDGGATIDGLSTDPPFDIYPDAGYDLGGSYTYGAGSPAAIIAGPGQATLPLAAVAISFGNLNGASTPGADGAASVSFTVTPSAGTNLTITENAARGGIVAIDGTSLDINSVTGGPIGSTPECLKNTAPYYADWVAFGNPACWCYEYQCGGDADGLSVGTSFTGIQRCTVGDLNILLAAFNVYEPGGVLNSGPGVGPVGICADFQHTGVGTSFTGIQRVTVGDLNVLLAGFNVYEPGGVLNSGPGIPACDGANYNFFETP